VVAHVQLHVVGAVAHAHVGRRPPGVLDRVGDRLLHHAVGGELDPGRERAALALDRQLHRQPGGSRALDEAVELLERGRRAMVDLQHAEQPLELDDRVAPGAGDEPRGGLGAVRVALEDAPRTAGLDDHHAHRVRDHVVHLARDAPALLGHRALGLGRAALASASSSLVQLARQAGAAAGGAAGEAEGDDEDGREEDLAGLQRSADRACTDDAADHQRHAGGRAAAILVRAEAEGQAE
jgi:hypothetical protein